MDIEIHDPRPGIECCDECDLFGEIQCGKHGDAAIEATREMYDAGEAWKALATLRRLALLSCAQIEAISGAITRRYGVP